MKGWNKNAEAETSVRGGNRPPSYSACIVVDHLLMPNETNLSKNAGRRSDGH